jgi:DNA-binding transcriptional ArsR family regulator
MERKKNTTWMYPELDLEELYYDGHFEKVVQVAAENMDLVMSHHRNANYEVLEKSIRMANVMASYLERSIQDLSDQALIAVGKLMGCIETLEKIQYENEQNRAAFEQTRLLGTKHLDRIVQALENYGSLSQSQMCEILDLQASTLSEALKKVRMTNLIQSSPYGKYKMYSLTEEGIRYGKTLRRKNLYASSNKPSAMNIEAAIKTLQLYLEEDETHDLCRDRIQESFGVVVGPGSRLSLHDSVRHHITKFSVEEIASEGNAAEIVIQGEEIEFIDYDELVTNVNTVMLTMADFV